MLSPLLIETIKTQVQFSSEITELQVPRQLTHQRGLKLFFPKDLGHRIFGDFRTTEYFLQCCIVVSIQKGVMHGWFRRVSLHLTLTVLFILFLIFI